MLFFFFCFFLMMVKSCTTNKCRYLVNLYSYCDSQFLEKKRRKIMYTMFCWKSCTLQHLTQCEATLCVLAEEQERHHENSNRENCPLLFEKKQLVLYCRDCSLLLLNSCKHFLLMFLLTDRDQAGQPVLFSHFLFLFLFFVTLNCFMLIHPYSSLSSFVCIMCIQKEAMVHILR